MRSTRNGPAALLSAALALSACTSANNFFFDAARKTAPTIRSGTGAALRFDPGEAALAWTFGNPVYETFVMLRDYDPAKDGGTVGLDNMYKSLYQTGSFYDEYRARCTSIAPEVIASPFPFGNAVTYDCAVNDRSAKHGHASREADGVKSGLNTWEVDYSGGKLELGAQEGQLADASGDLAVDEATWVHTPGQNDFSMRYHIEGNATTHAFAIKLVKYTAGGYFITIAGKGVSKGAGNSFLFKVTDLGNVSGAYYCYPADPTEAEMQAVDPTGSATVDPSCASYQADVDALVPFTSADVPVAASSFAGSSIYLVY